MIMDEEVEEKITKSPWQFEGREELFLQRWLAWRDTNGLDQKVSFVLYLVYWCHFNRTFLPERNLRVGNIGEHSRRSTYQPHLVCTLIEYHFLGERSDSTRFPAFNKEAGGLSLVIHRILVFLKIRPVPDFNELLPDLLFMPASCSICRFKIVKISSNKKLFSITELNSYFIF